MARERRPAAPRPLPGTSSRRGQIAALQVRGNRLGLGGKRARTQDRPRAQGRGSRRPGRRQAAGQQAEDRRPGDQRHRVPSPGGAVVQPHPGLEPRGRGTEQGDRVAAARISSDLVEHHAGEQPGRRRSGAALATGKSWHPDQTSEVA
jgi:hypothetical protein